MSELKTSGPTIAASAQLDRHLGYGEAAFMLLDAILLRLIELNLVSREELEKVIETAIATKRQMVEDGEHPTISAAAAGLLTQMANSLGAQPASSGNAPIQEDD